MSKRSKHSVAGVYLIIHSDGDKVYVGRSIHIQKRWTRHRWELNLGTHRNAPLQRAWAKHGESAFEFRIAVHIVGFDGAELEDALQQAEIDVLRQYPRAFNLMEAGEPAMIASEETRAKLSAIRKAMWAEPGYRERLGAVHRAKNADPEYVARRAIAVSAGKSTPEARAKTSAQSKARWEPGGVLRETQSAKRLANWEDPDYRARQSASRKASHADPEVKARRSAGLKAAWARRKAAGSSS